MSLHSTSVPLSCLIATLNAHLPSGWTADDDADTAPRTVTVVPVTTPDPAAVTLGGMPERARALFQVTAHADSRANARRAGDAIRVILAGYTGRKPTHPLTAPGYVFDPVRSGSDGHLVLAAGVHTFVETYVVGWQYRTPPAPPVEPPGV